MNRTEQFRTKNFEEEEWQKLFYKHQHRSDESEIGLSHQKAHRDDEKGEPKAQQEFVTTLKRNWKNSSPERG